MASRTPHEPGCRLVNRTSAEQEAGTTTVTHVAQKFDRLLEIYRHPDGQELTGADLARATGDIHRPYVTNLRKGRVESPGFEKLSAIAKEMCFPPEVWFEEGRERALLSRYPASAWLGGRV